MPPGRAWLAPAIHDRPIAAPAHTGRSTPVEVIAMRRVGVMGALGALLRTLRRRAAIRRFAMAAGVLSAGTALGALALAAGSTAAWADGPLHVKSAFSFENPASAAAAHGRYATIDVPGATATNAISVNDFAVVVGS